MPGSSQPRRTRFSATIRKGLTLAVLASTVCPGTSPALDWGDIEEKPEGPYSWLGSLSENARIQTDVSVRGHYNYGEDRTGEHRSAVGFFGLDVHKVVAVGGRDWATVVLQPYVTKLNNHQRHSPAFDSEHDGRLIYRNFFVNLTGLSRGGLNLRVGHFELPYGLEYAINTNGTLRDYGLGRSLGLKADWGASLNGLVRGTVYDVALTRGTGQSIRSSGSPYLLSGRLGTTTDGGARFAGGVSGVWGQTFAPTNPVERRRAALDASWIRKSLTLMAEVSAGRTGEADVVSGLFEYDWNNPNESVLLYQQWILEQSDLAGTKTTSVCSTVGARVVVRNGLALSCQWKHHLDDSRGQNPNDAALQMRVRF